MVTKKELTERIGRLEEELKLLNASYDGLRREERLEAANARKSLARQGLRIAEQEKQVEELAEAVKTALEKLGERKEDRPVELTKDQVEEMEKRFGEWFYGAGGDGR